MAPFWRIASAVAPNPTWPVVTWPNQYSLTGAVHGAIEQILIDRADEAAQPGLRCGCAQVDRPTTDQRRQEWIDRRCLRLWRERLAMLVSATGAL